MNADELRGILARGEDIRTEFKTTFNDEAIVSLVAGGFRVKVFFASEHRKLDKLGDKLGDRLGDARTKNAKCKD